MDSIDHAELHNTTFTANKVYGTGTCIGIKDSNYMLIQNSNFINNFSLENSAGFYLFSLQKLHLKNNYFYKNKAFLHGAIIYSRQNPFFISENNQFIENTSQGKGGVALISNIITPHITFKLKIINDIYINNTCKEGGALHI